MVTKTILFSTIAIVINLFIVINFVILNATLIVIIIVNVFTNVFYIPTNDSNQFEAMCLVLIIITQHHLLTFIIIITQQHLLTIIIATKLYLLTFIIITQHHLFTIIITTKQQHLLTIAVHPTFVVTSIPHTIIIYQLLLLIINDDFIMTQL